MNVKNLVLGLGIFIIFLFVLNYGIKTFYSEPKWEDYCGEVKAIPLEKNINLTQQMCEDQGGEWTQEYCDYYSECQKEYNLKKDSFNMKFFIISLIVGIITIIVGYGILSVEPVGSALIASGIGGIVEGTFMNWEGLSDFIKFILLLLVLIFLIYLAIRTNKKK